MEFVHLFHKYLLDVYYVWAPFCILGDIALTKETKMSDFMELTFYRGESKESSPALS